MSFGINAQQANQNRRNDLIIFEEQYAIMRQIILASAAGECSVTITETTMTQSTAPITITGTVQNPTVSVGQTIVIDGSTIVLGTTGTNLNSIIADINDAGIDGVIASKNATNYLIITYTAPAASTSYTAPAASTWSVTIGAGTANTALGITVETKTATTPASVNYFNVWQGSTTDPCQTDEMNEIISYFTNFGYNIERQTNSLTNKTFKWVVNY